MQLSQVLGNKKAPKALVTIPPEATVQEAIQVLCKHRIGALLAVDGKTEDIVGILTERDALRQCCEDCCTIDKVRVADIATRDVIVCHPDDNVHGLLRLMSTKHIRHLPVMDAECGRVVDIVSIGDILNALYEEDELKIRHLSDYLGGTYGSEVY